MSDGQSLPKWHRDLKNVTATASAKGNADYSPYMQGMANGLILALSIIEDKEPVYLDAPKEWLQDTGTPR
jgi:hypothetical protein